MKRLIVCTDGTWNVPDRVDRGQVRPSNVVKMALAVAPQDDHAVQQLVFYDKGIGTGAFDHLVGGVTGWGLSAKIQEAYRFVAEHYEPGDELYLFGFSRGAYTARSTAGLIRQCGVLKREYVGRLADGYELYRRRDDASHPAAIESQLFRKSFACEPVTPITCVGVWDTVGALGIPEGLPGIPPALVRLINRRWEFHDVKLSSIVRNAFHAVAIDERRPQFAATLWEQQEHAVGQQLEQVWFAGSHSNIGGGFLDTGLSDIAFLWMKEKTQALGLAFDEQYVRATIVPNALGELRESKTGVYAKFPDFVRPIGQAPHANEAVHRSAVQRLNAALNPPYAPANLLEYVQRHGPSIPAAQP